MAQFGDLRTPAGLTALNTYLLTRSYIDGFKPSQADVAVFAGLSAAVDEAKFPHVARWASHIASFPSTKRASYD
jgi:elongation factor 1-beta